MSNNQSISRRQFVTGTSGLLLSRAGEVLSQNPTASGSEDTRLALEGGRKAVQKLPERPLRWGEPERERLEAMVSQRSLFYWKGPQTGLLIDRFRAICPLEYVHSCSSGTAALQIAVAASGIGPGDEVITTPVTDIGSVIGVLYQQGVPVFADLDPDTYNLDAADVERRITKRTKAIIAVHLTGNPCDMRALKSLADRYGLILIEDCAQAWGARYRRQPIGTIGDFACFSLQNSKQVTCGGRGNGRLRPAALWGAAAKVRRQGKRSSQRRRIPGLRHQLSNERTSGSGGSSADGACRGDRRTPGEPRSHPERRARYHTRPSRLSGASPRPGCLLFLHVPLAAPGFPLHPGPVRRGSGNGGGRSP